MTKQPKRPFATGTLLLAAGVLGVALTAASPASAAIKNYTGYVCEVTVSTQTPDVWIVVTSQPNCGGTWYESMNFWNPNNGGMPEPHVVDRLTNVAVTAAATDARVSGSYDQISFFGSYLEPLLTMKILSY